MPELQTPSQVAAQVGVDEETIRRAIRSGDPPAQVTCAWEGIPASFDLIPGSLDEMADIEIQLMALQMREQRLARALAPLRRHYDVLLLDCPPNLSLLTTNALWAADRVIIP